MTMIPVRKPYTPQQLGQDYNRTEVRQQLGLLAQSVPPTSGRTVTAATTILGTDDVILFDATAGAIVQPLPQASQVQFLKVFLIQKDASGHSVTLTGTVSGNVNPTLGGQYKGMLLWTDGNLFYKLASI